MKRSVAAFAVASLVAAGCSSGATVDVEALEQNLDQQLEGSDLGMFVTGLEASGTRVIVSTQLGEGGGTEEAEAICGNVVSASYSSGDEGVTSDVSSVEVQDAADTTVATCEPQA